jgi:hypothetical protein
MGNPQYIQDAVDNFEDLYGGELTAKQRQNLVEALEYGGISLGMDVDDATEALSVWGDYTGDMERALDDVWELETILLNFDGAGEVLDDYLADKYIIELGITDEALGSYAALFTDFEKYRRHLEYEGGVFAPTQDGTLTYVFTA